MIKESISDRTKMEAENFIKVYENQKNMDMITRLSGWDIVGKIRDELRESTKMQEKELQRLFARINKRGGCPTYQERQEFERIINNYVMDVEIRKLMYRIIKTISSDQM